MMDEDQILLPTDSEVSSQEFTARATMNSCIDNPKSNVPLRITLSLALVNAADSTEVLCAGYIITSMKSNITAVEKSAITSAVFLGMFFGSIFIGKVADKLGRKFTLLWALFASVISQLGAAMAPNVLVLTIFRVVSGFGVGGSAAIMIALCAELVPCRIRGKAITVITSFWMVGSIFTALTAWIVMGDGISGTKIIPGAGWRVFALVTTIPIISALFCVYHFVPESPRFLLQKEKTLEAVNILNEISTIHVTAEELSGYNEALNSERSKNSVAESTPRFQYNFDFIKNVILLLFIWWSMSFGTYGVITWISTIFTDIGIGNPYAAAVIFALGDLPGNLLTFTYVDYVGRKLIVCVGMFATALFAVLFAINTGTHWLVITCAFLFNASSAAAWDALGIVTVECFPTSVRGLMSGILSSCGRIGGFTAQIVNGRLESNVSLLMLVVGVIFALGALASCALPQDQTGQPIQD